MLKCKRIYLQQSRTKNNEESFSFVTVKKGAQKMWKSNFSHELEIRNTMSYVFEHIFEMLALRHKVPVCH